MRPLDRLRWIASIAADRKLPPLALHIASTLAQYVDSHIGTARPGLHTLAADTGLHHSTVVKMLHALEHGGYLHKSVGGGRGRATEWTPQTVALAPIELEPETVATEPTVKTPETVAKTVGETVAKTVGLSKPPSGEQGRSGDLPPNPPQKTKSKPKKKNGADLFEEMPNFIPSESWEAWEQHLREKRKPLTPSSRMAQWKLLVKYRADGHDPVDVIERSIAGNWQGLYAETKSNGGTNGKRFETAFDRLHRACADPAPGNGRGETIEGHAEILGADG